MLEELEGVALHESFSPCLGLGGHSLELLYTTTMSNP